MAESISNIIEQRQYSGSGGNSGNNNNVVSRKKANNVGSELTASSKYNKANGRGFNKDSQQQKQFRVNGNNNHQREQRNVGNNEAGNSKYRNRCLKNERVDHSDVFNLDDENVYDEFNEIYDIDEHMINKRGGGNSSDKKRNMNHLFNFRYFDKQRGNGRSFYSNSRSNGRWSSAGNWYSRQSFSKEQFLQANCQFVVQKCSIDYSPHYADPDLPIDWTHVEQVHLHSMQTLKCPICLSEPQAGKITRCGHVYCWSCLLHYLALSDKPWRKCPVCSESIYKNDIRSVRGIVSRSLKAGDWIHFRLMCRERGSVVFYPRKNWQSLSSKVESDEFLMTVNKKKYAHLLFVHDETILNEIIERENLELLKQLEEDEGQPEVCFIKQALEENNQRHQIIQNRINQRKLIENIKSLPKDKNEYVDLLPSKSVVVYGNAFDETIELSEQSQLNTVPEEQIDSNEHSNLDGAKNSTVFNSLSNVVPQNQIYFYQADDIYHAYMNGLNTRILIHEYGSYETCPDELHVRIEAIESYFMTEELRSQFRFLSHLPLTCEFQVIEIRLHPPLISSPTMQFFADEIHRRRQLRTRKERLETRRQQQAELAETQKLFSQYPPEMMYIPQKSFPINGTDSMEEFPAMTSSVTSSASPPSASIQIFDENFSPTTSVSFAQMLKQQAPSASKSATTNKTVNSKTASIDISTKPNPKKKSQEGHNSDDDSIDQDGEYYASVPNFHSSFSLEEVFNRLKLVNGEENPISSMKQATGNVPSKKKNKKNKQVLFATGLGGQAKL